MTTVDQKEPDIDRYAHLERKTEKFYAVQYKGSIRDLPYFMNSALRKRYGDINEYKGNLMFDGNKECPYDSYLILTDQGITVMNEEDFHNKYVRLSEV